MLQFTQIAKLSEEEHAAGQVAVRGVQQYRIRIVVNCCDNARESRLTAKDGEGGWGGKFVEEIDFFPGGSMYRFAHYNHDCDSITISICCRGRDENEERLFATYASPLVAIEMINKL